MHRRNRFFGKKLLLILSILAAVATPVYMTSIEPVWLKVQTISLDPNPTCRLVHISDLHYVGDHAYMTRVVNHINRLKPDIVCITGDLVNDSTYQSELISLLSEIEAPILALSGNHEDWGDVDRGPFKTMCLQSGGKWLDDAAFSWGDIGFYGCTNINKARAAKGDKCVLLCHYPKVADNLGNLHYDLILAGHTHGGQIRVPFYGALAIPYNSGTYEKGLYHLSNGTLHVSPGIGWFFAKVRLNCRPEITLMEL